jgi:hypothetical protein
MDRERMDKLEPLGFEWSRKCKMSILRSRSGRKKPAYEKRLKPRSGRKGPAEAEEMHAGVATEEEVKGLESTHVAKKSMIILQSACLGSETACCLKGRRHGRRIYRSLGPAAFYIEYERKPSEGMILVDCSQTISGRCLDTHNLNSIRQIDSHGSTAVANRLSLRVRHSHPLARQYPYIQGVQIDAAMRKYLQPSNPRPFPFLSTELLR